MDYSLAILNIRKELKDYIIKNNLKSLVIGISGGIDSALCAVLAKPVCKDLGIQLYGRSIPIISNKSVEKRRANKIGRSFCDDYSQISELNNPYGSIVSQVQYEGWDPHLKETNIRRGNIKARLRMIYLYDLAYLHKGMVLSTDNYTEYLLGFSTIMGDWGDFGMIQNIWKTEVYDMTEWIRDNEFDGFGDFVFKEKEILSEVLKADATDGLGISNTDLDQIMPGWTGTSRDGYKIVDDRLKKYLDFNVTDLDDPVIYRHIKTHFKRNWPINIDRKKIFPLKKE